LCWLTIWGFLEHFWLHLQVKCSMLII
jgi:hypothetical protein